MLSIGCQSTSFYSNAKFKQISHKITIVGKINWSKHKHKCTTLDKIHFMHLETQYTIIKLVGFSNLIHLVIIKHT